ncbi:hypothetical protein Tco_0722038 [Tanacetum coccineum]
MQISGENKPLVSSLMKEAEKPENVHSGLEAPRHLSFAFLSYHRSQNLHSTAASRPTVQRAFLFVSILNTQMTFCNHGNISNKSHQSKSKRYTTKEMRKNDGAEPILIELANNVIDQWEHGKKKCGPT